MRWTDRSGTSLHPGEAIEPLLTDTVGEDVDHIRHIGFGRLGERGNHLFGPQRLGNGRSKPHQLDAEPRIDGLDFVGEKPRQTLHITHRRCSAGTDRLDAVIDTEEQKIEPARALPSRLKFGAELCHQLARIAGDRLGRADGLRKIAADFDDLLRPGRLDRFAHSGERLVEASAGFRSKTQRQCRARCAGKIRNCLEAELP
jgi:hypothetical protein